MRPPAHPDPCTRSRRSSLDPLCVRTLHVSRVGRTAWKTVGMPDWMFISDMLRGAYEQCEEQTPVMFAGKLSHYSFFFRGRKTTDRVSRLFGTTRDLTRRSQCQYQLGAAPSGGVRLLPEHLCAVSQSCVGTGVSETHRCLERLVCVCRTVLVSKRAERRFRISVCTFARIESSMHPYGTGKG